jgi:hypothetical protein
MHRLVLESALPYLVESAAVSAMHMGSRDTLEKAKEATACMMRLRHT